ncbi:cingulin-like protein 1 [Gouania willdenowi]|uniref:cingulin-like protein 1 n=1 Tax=Gouania willdenowi TaxID=441366 RepID=UPI0010551E58|nr:cingulin-like protein 1 [Gouania willdenowi]
MDPNVRNTVMQLQIALVNETCLKIWYEEEYENLFSEFQVEMMKLKNENQSIREQLYNLQHQSDATNVSVSSQPGTEKQRNEEIVKLQERIRDLELDLKEEKKAGEASKKQVEMLRENEVVLTSMSENSEEINQQLQEDRNNLIQENATLVAVMEKMKDQVNEKHFVIKNLKKELYDLQSEMDEQTNPFPLEIQHEKIRKEFNKLYWQNKELESELEVEKQKLQAALELYEKAQDELRLMQSSTRGTFNSGIEQLQEDHNVLVQENNSLVAEIKVIKDQMRGKDLEIQSLHQQLSDVEQRMKNPEEQPPEDNVPVTKDGCEHDHAHVPSGEPVELQAGTNSSSTAGHRQEASGPAVHTLYVQAVLVLQQPGYLVI